MHAETAATSELDWTERAPATSASTAPVAAPFSQSRKGIARDNSWLRRRHAIQLSDDYALGSWAQTTEILPSRLVDFDIFAWEPANLMMPRWLADDHLGVGGTAVTVSLDPGASFWAGALDDQGRRDAALRSVETRIAELRSEAASELAEWSVASEEALRSFLQAFRPTERPAIFLSDAGLLSAVWDGPNGEHVGLKFKDETTIFYVLIGARIVGRTRAHAEGSAGPDGVIRQLYAMGVRELVSA